MCFTGRKKMFNESKQEGSIALQLKLHQVWINSSRGWLWNQWSTGTNCSSNSFGSFELKDRATQLNKVVTEPPGFTSFCKVEIDMKRGEDAFQNTKKTTLKNRVFETLATDQIPLLKNFSFSVSVYLRAAQYQYVNIQLGLILNVNKARSEVVMSSVGQDSSLSLNVGGLVHISHQAEISGARCWIPTCSSVPS